MALRVGEQYSSKGSGPYSSGERAERSPLIVLGDPEYVWEVRRDGRKAFRLVISDSLGLPGYLEGPISLIGVSKDEAAVFVLGRMCCVHLPGGSSIKSDMAHEDVSVERAKQ